MRRCLVVGNWKMHGTKAVVDDLVAGLRNEMNLDGRADELLANVGLAQRCLVERHRFTLGGSSTPGAEQ